MNDYIVEFMDREGVIQFEIVTEAENFCGAIQLAMIDAERLEIDLSSVTWVSVQEDLGE